MPQVPIVALLISFAVGCSQADRPEAASGDAAAAPPPSAEASPPDSADPILVVPAEHVIEPGVRVGRVTWRTARDELLRLYGPAYVDTAVHIGEGETMAGAVVDARSDSAFAVVWDDSARAHVREVRVLGKTYRTREGVGLGSTLADLEDALGPFRVLGMSWDYAGTVLLDGTVWSEYDGLIILRLVPTAAGRAHPAYGRVRGDRPYASADADVKALELTVGEVIVRLKPGSAVR